MLSYLKKHKKIILISLFTLLVGAGVFGFIGSRMNIKAARAQAGQTEKINLVNWFKDPGNATLWLIGTVVSFAVFFLGVVLGVLLRVLFLVARYNNFINSPAIVTGWVVLRDLCNIFFIVIFLVMVVSTVLDIDAYSYSHILKKLLIMAVLINFSKVICGVFIDAAQVVMMAFMSSIGQLGAKYFTYMLGIDQIMAKASNMRDWDWGFPENWSTILMSYVLALIYMIVTIATVLVLVVVLVQRVVMLWIYVVLSPAAYFLSAFPQGSSYSGKWWSEFVKYVTIGPIIAFFLWLAFVSMGNVDNQKQILKDMSGTTTDTTQQTTATQSAGPQIGITEGGSPSHVVKFIIGIALLLGGLMAAQSIGGMAGNFAGSTVKRLQSAGTAPLRGAWGLTKVGFETANLTQAKWTGQDLHLGRRVADLKEGFARKKKKDIADVYSRAKALSQKGGFRGFVGSMGTKDFVDQKLQGFMWNKGVREAIATSSIVGGKFRLFGGKVKNDKKKQEDAEKEMEKLNKEREGVMTSEEETNKLRNLADQEGSLSNNRGELNQKNEDLVNAIKDLGKQMEDAKYSGDQKLADTIKEQLSKKQEEQQGAQESIQKNNQALEDIRTQRTEHEAKKARGEIKIDDARVEQIEEEQKEQKRIKDKAVARQIKYMPITPETDAVERAAMAEAAKNLPDTSDELLDHYKKAKSQKDAPQMKAIMAKLMQNNDLNDLAGELGYAEGPGWTEKDVERWRGEGKNEEEINEYKERFKGLSNLMKDEFKNILPEQQILGFQMDISNIAKKLNNGAFMGTVKSKYGKYEQNDMETQQMLATDHMSKQDPETLARSGTRWVFGGKGTDGNYSVNPAGIKVLLGASKMIYKEIVLNSGRYNKRNTLALSEEPNMRILEAVTDTLEGEQRDNWIAMTKAIKDFGKELRAGGKDFKESFKKYSDVIESASEKRNV